VSDREPLVSVVTPVHNGAEFLRECIESVLAQTYRNYEYLIVNNCSTDESRSIAMEYAVRDARIRVLDTETLLPQVRNHNEALRRIAPESRYCKIIQADDWMFPACLREMVALAERYPTIGIVGSYRLRGREIGGQGLPYQETFLKGRELCRRQLLGGLFLFGSPSSTLVRSDIVRKRVPFYVEGGVHVDTEAYYEIMLEHDFGFVHQLLSFARTDNASISSHARQLFPEGLDKWICVRKYGRLVLDEAEYARCLKQVEAYYFSELGDRVLWGAGRRLVDYHRKGLATIGESFWSARLMKHIAWAALDAVGNPKKTIGRLCRPQGHRNG